jgi:hypothetical protein
MLDGTDSIPVIAADPIGGSAGPHDINFNIARPRYSLLANAGIDAVMYPLFGRVDKPQARHPQVYRLIQLWRTRVAELAGAGWEPLADADPAGIERRISQLRNCSPPFVAAHPSSSCGLSSLCPFCWARAAMKIWSLASGIFFPTQTRPGRRFDAPACCLVETSRKHRLPGDDPELLTMFLADRVRRPPRGIPVGPFFRQHELQKYPMLGGYEVIAVSTDARGRNQGAWEVAIRQLLAVKAEHVPLFVAPQYRNIRIRVVKHSQVDPLTLARAVARLCRYPPWLLRGNSEQVVGYLGARAGLRLWAAFGNFRGGNLGADIQQNGNTTEP